VDKASALTIDGSTRSAWTCRGVGRRRSPLGVAPRCRRRPHERGSSLAEFAVVVPILMLLALGIVDLSRGVMVYNTLSHATREGARYASVRSSKSDDPATLTKVAADIRQYAANLDPDQVGVVAVWPSGNVPGAHVTIDTTYPFETVTPFIPVGAVTIKSHSEATITY
jgi:Flp pilus assembly protein TadG